jgi:hypothetical protein
MGNCLKASDSVKKIKKIDSKSQNSSSISLKSTNSFKSNNNKNKPNQKHNSDLLDIKDNYFYKIRTISIKNLIENDQINKKSSSKDLKFCKIKNCGNKEYIDVLCVFCYDVFSFYYQNKPVIIDNSHCPFCIKSSLKTST